jgi:hypothetical protein
LGHEQGHSCAAQVFGVLKAFWGCSLLAYLLEKDEQPKTIGEIFRQLEEETGKLAFMGRLQQHAPSGTLSVSYAKVTSSLPNNPTWG